MARTASAHPARLEWRNNMAVVGWVFMAIWTGMLVLFTWLFIREGGFNQFSPPVEIGIMALFWLFSVGGCRFFFAMPRVQVTIVLSEVVVRERWAWRLREERFSLRKLAAPVFSEEKDSDGDAYFKSTLTLPSGRKVDIAEAHDKKAVQAAHDRLIAAMT
ncbi:MAG: hypothetical protein KJ796_20870 [Alphaproteobacteria bacterium]|nr:hypothetical protein [Alphaproteobacteria bacterium]